MKKQVKCSNVGVCTRAGKVFVVDDEEQQEMVCPECGEPLEEVKEAVQIPVDDEESKKKKKRIITIAAVVIGVVAICFVVWSIIGGSSQEISKIKLDKKNITLVVGEKDVIKATVVDKDGKEIKDAKVTYKWDVKDEKVASVTQGGEVVALKKGKTSIVVKIEGDKKNRHATCQVEVKKKSGIIPGGEGEDNTTHEDVLVTKLSVASTKVTLKEGVQADLKLTIEPSNYTEGVSVESSNPEVAVVEDGVIKAKKAGSADILVKTEKSGKSVTINVTVSKKDDGGTGGGRENTGKGSYNGTLKLSYGTYTGRIENGYPNGQGKLVYKTTRQISRYDSKGRTAQAGESVQGTFKNGFFTFGKHYDANGNLIESLNIGSPVEGVYESK